MDEYQEPVQHEEERKFGGLDAHQLLPIVVVLLLLTAAVAFGYGYHERSLVNQLNTQVSNSNGQLSALQGQVSALTAKLNGLSVAPTAAVPPTLAVSSAPAESASVAPVESTDTATPSAAPTTPAPSAAAAAKPAHRKHVGPKKPSAVDTKFAKLQAQLDDQGRQLGDQEKQLKDTQDAMEKNRADLEGNISSTRDELNGSIAKTHDELVLLEKRGERSYFEFDLSKSKQFQRIGPLTLSLRKADTKHKSYDLAMIVDDNELNKKKVNLYEPIWIHTENQGQPVQIVVNRIDKDTIHGYVSAPKYKLSELASAGAAATVTPVSTKGAGTTSAPDQPQQPPQPQP